MECQNFDFYIFGKNGKIDLFNKSDEKKLLQEFVANSQDKLQMTVYRKDSLFYYVYVRKLTNTNDYLGICLKFNESYCKDNEKIFKLFEEAIKTQIEEKKKILKSDLKGNTIFVTNDFSRNRVEISKLEVFFRNRFRDDFQQDFSLPGNSFDQGDAKQQYVSFQDEPTYITETIKRYNYVTITPKPIENSNGQKVQNWFYIIPLGISILYVSFLLWISDYHIISKIFSIIITLLGISIYILAGRTKNKLGIQLVEKSKEDPFSVVGIFLAIFSILTSFCWGILTQYSDSKTPITNLYNDNYVIKWNDIISKTDTANNNIVFIVDASKSVCQNNQQNFNADSLNKIINGCGWISHNRTYSVGNKYSDIIRAKLKILLYRIGESKIKGTYSIIQFSKNTELIEGHSNLPIVVDNLRKSFNYVDDSLNFVGDTTNFIQLLDFLKNNYCNQQFDPYDKAKYTFVFLSDYIHDKQRDIKENDDEYIIATLNKIRKSSVFSNFYFIKPFSEEKKLKNTISISQLINDKSQLHFKSIDILTEQFKISTINYPEPLVFRYSSYFFSDSLCSIIDFGNLKQFEIKALNIGIKYFENQDSRQEFFVKSDKDYYRKLESEEFIPCTLYGTYNKIDLRMKGHVTKQYPFAEIIVSDMNKHIDYCFEVVFLEKLPQFLRWVIPIFFGLFSLYLVLLFCPKALYKKVE